MAETIIKVENLSKRYRLGTISTGTLSHDLKRWWQKQTSKEDGYRRIDEIEQHSEYWALKDVSFEIKQGEAVGIIGKNGAGKSTLLKILSRVTSPTNGTVKIGGRIASLLEVGTGFHPELTGRENTFMNGAILGMSKAEIRAKFDEIVDFSGVEKYIDTPVKRYSSGMYVRLAFAVAAHLEPEILIVDEVLAVGDAEFQKKCLGKMEYVSKNEGRTVLFVSHNMGAVKSLCFKGILLNKGNLVEVSDIDSTLAAYRKISIIASTIETANFSGALRSIMKYMKVYINEIDSDHNDIIVSPNDLIQIEVITRIWQNIKLKSAIAIFKEGLKLITLHDSDDFIEAPVGLFKSIYRIPSMFLRPGIYSISIGAVKNNEYGDWIWGTDITHFEILEEWSDNYKATSVGIVNLNHNSERIFLGK